jgi:hypothetical protein
MHDSQSSDCDCSGCREVKLRSRLYLWKISVGATRYWDMYKAAIVVAATKEDAALIHPDAKTAKLHHGSAHWWNGHQWVIQDQSGHERPLGNDCWMPPDLVTAQRIGVADDGLPAGTVVLTDYIAC